DVRVVGEEVEELAHREVDRLLALTVAGEQRRERVLEQVDDPVEDVPEDREVERLLRLPVIVQARDVDPGSSRDLARRRALEAPRGEDLFGRREDASLGGSRRLSRLVERRLHLAGGRLK